MKARTISVTRGDLYAYYELCMVMIIITLIVYGWYMFFTHVPVAWIPKKVFHWLYFLA